MITWSSIRALTVEECKADILTMLQSVGFSATSWQEGSAPSALVQIGALTWSKCSEVIVALRDFQHIDTATGDALTALAVSAYSLDRLQSVAARYTITLTCGSGGGPYSLTLGGVIVSDGQYTYRNVDDGTVYPVTLPTSGSVTLTFEAEEPGAASSVTATTITQLVTAYADVTLGSQAQGTVGLDAESDARLRARCKSQWGLLALDSVTATLEATCLAAAPGVTRVAVNDSNPRGAGTFDVWLASDLGAADAGSVAACYSAVTARVLGGAVYGQVQAANEVAVNVTGTIWYAPNLTAAQADAAAQDALTAYLATVPIGGASIGAGLSGVVPLNELENAIRGATVNGASAIRAVRLTVPAADTSLVADEVAVLGTVTLTKVPANS